MVKVAGNIIAATKMIQILWYHLISNDGDQTSHNKGNKLHIHAGIH